MSYYSWKVDNKMASPSALKKSDKSDVSISEIIVVICD